MKTAIVRIALLAGLLAALPAAAGNPWITHFDGLRGQVSEIRPDRSAARILHAYPSARGESSTRIAVVAGFAAMTPGRLLVFDKATRKVVADWPIVMAPEQRMGGDTPDIVLLDDAAYVLVHALDFDPAATVRNSLGGIVSLLRVDLDTGTTREMPLDDDFWRPQLLNMDGVPVVAEWRRGAMSRLSPDGKSMTKLFARGELSGGMSVEQAERVWSTHFPCAEFVAIPGVGVFQQSKTGHLQRITDARLQPLPEPRASIPLGPVNQTQLMLAASSVNGTAIAVIRQVQKHRTLAFIDATSLATIWERDLDAGAYIWATAAAGPDAVMFVDRYKGLVVKFSRTGRQVLHELPSDSYFHHARVVSAGTP